MNKAIDRNETCSKRYKSCSPQHFSKWRFHFQRVILHCFVFPLLIARWRPIVYGKANVPRRGPFIVAANHITMLDPPLVSYAVKYPIAYMAKKELFVNRWVAEFFRSQGCFALDRDNPDSATLKTALNVLKSPAGWALGIFPEGGRSTTGRISPLKKGLGALAQKTGAPVLPVGIARESSGRFQVAIGPLLTDVSNADAVQETVYQELVRLTTTSLGFAFQTSREGE